MPVIATLRRLKRNLSLAFNKNAITTQLFQKYEDTPVKEEFGNGIAYHVRTKVEVWAEATKVGEDKYHITEKRLSANAVMSAASPSSEMRAAPIMPIMGSTFFRAEIPLVFKALEQEYRAEGLLPARKQPFKRRVYVPKKRT